MHFVFLSVAPMIMEKSGFIELPYFLSPLRSISEQACGLLGKSIHSRISECNVRLCKGLGLTPRYWEVPKIRGNPFHVPIIRVIVFWRLYWGSPIDGNCHVTAPVLSKYPPKRDPCFYWQPPTCNPETVPYEVYCHFRRGHSVLL